MLHKNKNKRKIKTTFIVFTFQFIIKIHKDQYKVYLLGDHLLIYFYVWDSTMQRLYIHFRAYYIIMYHMYTMIYFLLS